MSSYFATISLFLPIYIFYLFQEIGPESPANNRLKTIRELSDVVLVKRLEEVKYLTCTSPCHMNTKSLYLVQTKLGPT